MFQYPLHALRKSFLAYRFTRIHDKGVTEVLLFPLYPQHAMASTTILELAEEHRKKYFPEMKFTIVPAFYNKPDYLQNLADSIKDI
jgi:ferrochelatase